MRAITAALLLVAGCGADPPQGSSAGAPLATPLPRTVLGQRLSVAAAPGAERARAVWTEDGAERRSADVAVSGSEAAVALLGLRPGATYQAVVEQEGPGGVSRSAPVDFATAALPPAVAGLTLEVSGAPPEGLVLVNNLAAVSPGVLAAFDGQGQLRWYRLFDGPLPVVEAKQLPSGNLVAFLGTTTGWLPVVGGYVEVAPTGEQLRTLQAAPPLFTDNHELLITGEGTPEERIHLFGYDARPVDLGPIGHPGTADMVAHHVQRQLPSGAVEFAWSAWDHLEVTDAINLPFPAEPAGQDLDHPNSLQVTPEGDYLVSFRNLDAVWRLDGLTGEVQWRLGGVRSDFTFLDDPQGGFSGQHTASLLPDGHLLVFDNGTHHEPPASRAAEYALDLEAHTARLVWSFTPPGGGFNQFTGSAYRDAAGTTWVGMSERGEIYRVAADGSVLWSARLLRDGQPVRFYRAVPIAGLQPAP
ncbi:MAG: aryl-sulfate sulfotransferase [Anaeromyxobacter sp.]